jgi:hypothetical protein
LYRRDPLIHLPLLLRLADARLPTGVLRARVPPAPNAARRCPHLNPRPRARILASGASFRGSLCSRRFRPKNMARHIFQFESELQNIPEAAPETLAELLHSEKLARNDSSALSGVEHLMLLIGKSVRGLESGLQSRCTKLGDRRAGAFRGSVTASDRSMSPIQTEKRSDLLFSCASDGGC